MHQLIEKHMRLPWSCPLLFMLLAGAVALTGASSTPLEDHDALVAQTAQTMLNSGNWLVPEFNNEYRLQKPPLSYWLVASTALLLTKSQVTPLSARAPSILAAIGMVLLAYWLSLLLFNRRTAFVAALFTLSSLGFFTWSHSARPDMLYAFGCTALFPLWIKLSKPDDKHTEVWAILFWIAVGLTTLTKGPQGPAILLVAFVLHAVVSNSGLAAILQRMRPLRGILILAIILAPWWLLLRHAVGAQTLANSQLSGSLLTPTAVNNLTVYYFVRSPLFWLPWALLLPFGYLAFSRNWRQAPGILGFSIIIALVVLTFGPQYREHYMLPWQVPACTLIAAGTVAVPASRYWLWLPWSIAFVGGMWMTYTSGEPALLAFIPCAIALGMAADNLINERDTWKSASLIALGVAAGLLQAGVTPSIWSENRFQEAALADAARPYLEQDTAIATINVVGASFVYALKHPVTDLNNTHEMCAWLKTLNQPTLIIFRSSKFYAVTRFLEVEKVITTARRGLDAAILSAGSQCAYRAG